MRVFERFEPMNSTNFVIQEGLKILLAVVRIINAKVLCNLRKDENLLMFSMMSLLVVTRLIFARISGKSVVRIIYGI